jgi:phage gp46-like protein
MADDIALVRNPNTGRFNFQWKDGDVVFDRTCEHEVMSRLVEKRAKWWADADGAHGSRLSTITHINASTRSEADAYAREALQPMVDANRIAITKVVVDVGPIAGSRLLVRVFYRVTSSGAERTAIVPV